MRNIAILSVLLAFSVQVSSQNFSFMYDGALRTYKVHLPTGYEPGQPHPLVLNLHGLGSNGFQQELYSGFNELANQEGIVTVYPDGIDSQWNVYFASGVDDVGFLSALIDTMIVNYSIDITRVYACGMSMGGYMSYRLACQLEERIAAIASVTGLLVFSPCAPSRPIPVLQIHGTQDGIVPYEGVAETISFWTGFNDCPEEPVVYDIPDSDTTDQSTVTVTEYFPCSDSTRVKLYTVHGGEHTWPGSPPIIGVTNQDIDANVEIWNFFRQYTTEGSTGISTMANECGFKVYPNPASDHVICELPGNGTSAVTLIIRNAQGMVIRTILSKGNSQLQISLDGMASGIYFLEYRNGKEIYRQKAIVR